MAEPRVAGRIDRGSERTAEQKCSNIKMVKWVGRYGGPANVPGHHQETGMVAWWESWFATSTQCPPAATQHLHAEPHSYREEQLGYSGLASRDLSGYTVHDYDEEILEEGEVQDEHGF
ncbi:hypothetical protein NDU88_002359 [Pleurodeles waltl]|uniref:Uncharacterized protein n=1 Tax=Pleurodeles waltl TaxID=8319 RepID=A0AAV7T366_PLEWA|nr:hypothetical protein NDU88_002359 [Pleurodeles waltl]